MAGDSNTMSTKKLRVLVIGVGSIGERHVRCYLATGRAEIGICELNPELRVTIAERYDIKESFDNLDAALDAGWDAALVATPAHTHIPIALTVARAGINLIIEKPLSTSLDGIEELRKIVVEKNLVAAVSYNYRAHPGLTAMKKALDSGRFGKPRQLYAMVGQMFPFYRPAYRDIYFADRAQGGGAIQDSITHTWNLSEWFIGPMNRIAVDADHQQLEDVDVEDTVHALARHGDVMASYTVSLYQQPSESSLTIVCEKGTLRFELHKNRWRVMTEPEGTWEDESCVLAERDTWYTLNADAMLDAVAGIAAPRCTLEDGIQTLRVNLAALKSAETKTWREV
jgi:predicted dehydrogenase